MTRIQLVLVDDWELRGDGSGDMRAIQFAPLRRLLEIYERHGLRASINAEVMQQLHHRAHSGRHPHLGELADEWEAAVMSAFRRGHDVQLHVHSQWHGASYVDGSWHLPSPWSILELPADDVGAILTRGKEYLEALLRTIDPAYACVSFRSGSWCLAPSDFILGTLATLGITFDMSIVDGIAYTNDKVRLDYRKCEEGFQPFYPDMRDARRVASGPSPIVCLPTFSFRPSLLYDLRQVLDAARKRIARRLKIAEKALVAAPPNATPVIGGSSATPYGVWKARERLVPQVRSKILIGDLSALDFKLMVQMIKKIRRKAARRHLEIVPVILENHTKDITEFRPLQQFAAYVASQPDLEVITLTDVHRNLKAGMYHVLTKRDLRL
jgi:hypothetical protein